MWHWEFFTPEEVLSPDGMELYNRFGVCAVSPRLLEKLTKLRQLVDRPLLINNGELRLRGYRSYAENQSAEGRKHSMHMLGLAADVSVSGMSVQDIAKAAEECGFTGLGKYPTKNFVHCDVRYNVNGGVTRWTLS